MNNATDDKKKYWNNQIKPGISWALSHLLKDGRPVLIIAPDNLYASRLEDELQFFSSNHSDILHFPDWETLPYDHFSPHQDILSERLATLYRAANLKSGTIITSVATLMHRLPPAEHLIKYTFLLKIGDTLNIDSLRSKLTQAGYRAVNQVQEHGEFAIRGSIIDLFPMGGNTPYRIDLFDDEIDSIQTFSTETQRSISKIDEINLLPAKEFPLTDEAIELFRHQWRSEFHGNPLDCAVYQDVSEGIASAGVEYYLPLFFEKTTTLFDYLPENTLIVTIDSLTEKAEEFTNEVAHRYEVLRYDIERPILAPEKLFIDPGELGNLKNSFSELLINANPASKDKTFELEYAPDLTINSKSKQPLSRLSEFLEEQSNRVLFCAESNGRREVLLKLFNTINLIPQFYKSWNDFLQDDSQYGIAIAPLEESFINQQDQISIITEPSFFGVRVMQRRLRKRSKIDPELIIKDLSELKINDPIVHIDHGVGRFTGLKTLTVGNQLAEFLCIEYQGNDKLYVPVSSLHLVSRYTGTDSEHAPINKLGTEQWSRSKRRAAEKASDVAAELLEIYAKRAALSGFQYKVPDEQYTLFANGFPFEETPDQQQAIEQIFQDMSSDKPMDRVICGDVGFGKTEVAIRAAFLAAINNKQVAVLVPTTLLAEQHYQTFQDRFADWPIEVEVLSRFKTGKKQKEILARLAEGKVDIVIGTHKLLQPGIQFHDLGLVVIDEEHRFGVKQKENLKALRTKVDVLTMTATPIPRTLNMAFSGIRDLSIIATAPAKRLSVKTFVHEYQDHVIQEAIQREVMRGGQVYFLHNDVATISKKADDIKLLVPEIRISVAHGQMHERELERVMSEFYHRHANVLVCSTIIESGIDIPTANTIIINRSDKFGLAQLHQLRGRVGRSHHQAYAYLLTPPKASISSDAKKRLDAITSLDELGVGFTLATHDLEIRGTGELLGEEQSGNIHEVGFSLYMDLLSRAIESLKSGKEPDLDKSLLHKHTEVDLRLTALIPEDFINDVQLRLIFYKRIANARSEAELDDIQVEMIDRFGLLPAALKTLFAITELKLEAIKIGISKIEANEKSGKFEFDENPNVTPERIIELIQANRFKLSGPNCLRFNLAEHQPAERIKLVKNTLAEL